MAKRIRSLNQVDKEATLITDPNDGILQLNPLLKTVATEFEVFNNTTLNTADIDTVNIKGKGTTIDGTNVNNGWLLIGTTSNAIGIDDNEIYSSGSDMILGTINNNVIIRKGITTITTFDTLSTSFTSKVSVNNVFDSVSSTTGAITTTGGLGISKSTYIGENLNVNGNTTLGNTNSDTLTLNATATVTANMKFNDNKHLYLGTSNDLDIYHDGSNSYITEQGTGDLYVQSTSGSINLRTSTTENAIICKQDSSVELYYNNVKKLETTSTGVSVTGGKVEIGNTKQSSITYNDIDKSLDFSVA